MQPGKPVLGNGANCTINRGRFDDEVFKSYQHLGFRYARGGFATQEGGFATQNQSSSIIKNLSQ